ncbi:hypothetical protein Metho_1318 [Methanomethylovorans hollandica DSM 15978]|uniref:Uncharacterized protein n=1 Tax=Methanomethylovorans hollandica (strain DSM 15978 / NBRC 107637 / DMS1) TaxID=867904 RepID=L0KXW0_METHD|nr:hypothetical protein Metho_1318 [Methanomethylovorans hollandica DSM 15978]
MIVHLFKLFLTLNSLLLSLLVFLIKEDVVLNPLHPYLSNLPAVISYLLYFGFIFLLTLISVHLTNFLDTDTIDKLSISVIEPANDAFLPSYLGYFFVALSAPNIEVFLYVFGIICIFIYHSRISYFNPIFLLIGFNFYYIKTNNNTKILVITQKQLKEPKNAEFENLKRINNYTFMDMGRQVL